MGGEVEVKNGLIVGEESVKVSDRLARLREVAVAPIEQVKQDIQQAERVAAPPEPKPVLLKIVAIGQGINITVPWPSHLYNDGLHLKPCERCNSEAAIAYARQLVREGRLKVRPIIDLPGDRLDATGVDPAIFKARSPDLSQMVEIDSTPVFCMSGDVIDPPTHSLTDEGLQTYQHQIGVDTGRQDHTVVALVDDVHISQEIHEPLINGKPWHANLYDEVEVPVEARLDPLDSRSFAERLEDVQRPSLTQVVTDEAEHFVIEIPLAELDKLPDHISEVLVTKAAETRSPINQVTFQRRHRAEMVNPQIEPNDGWIQWAKFHDDPLKGVEYNVEIKEQEATPGS